MTFSPRLEEKDLLPESARPAEARNRDPKEANPGSGATESPAEGRTGASREHQVASSEVPWPMATPSKGAHILSEEEGSSSRDEDCPARGAPPHMASPARYRCNDSSCSSSQEDATTRLTERELARDLIQENLSRSQALIQMEELQFHDPRRPQPGGHRSGQAGRPATTKPNPEQAQEGVRGSGAPGRAWQCGIPKRKAVTVSPSQATGLNTPAWATRSSWRNWRRRGSR